MGWLFHGQDLQGVLDHGQRPIRCCTTWGSQHLKGCMIIYTILLFFLVRSQKTSILRDALQNLSTFPTRVMKNSHLLVQFNPPPHPKKTNQQAKAKRKSFSSILRCQYSQQRITLSVRPSSRKRQRNAGGEGRGREGNTWLIRDCCGSTASVHYLFPFD